MKKIESMIMRINNGSMRGGQTKLANLINVSQPSVARWLNGSSEPSPENLSNMAEIFGCTVEEVREAFNEINEFTPSLKAIPLTPSNTIQLPILADVPAGLPEFSDRDVEMFVDIPRFLFPGADFIVRCIGDSLEPKIHKGDFCVIRKMEEPIDGRAMLVKSENGVCMKVIHKKKGQIELCSTNPKYKPFVSKELTIIGLIIGHWSRDDRENWK